MSNLDKAEVARARAGPRELKDPRSRGYAIQTLFALKRYAESLQCDQERVKRELEEIDKYRHWEVLGYASREELLAAELSEAGLVNVTKAQAVAADPAVAALKPEGTAGPGRGKTVAVRHGLQASQTSSESVERIVRRLKRDAPAIAEALARGEYPSARAAGLAAGIVQPRISVPLDVDRAAAILVRILGADRAAQLAQRLVEVVREAAAA